MKDRWWVRLQEGAKRNAWTGNTRRPELGYHQIDGAGWGLTGLGLAICLSLNK